MKITTNSEQETFEFAKNFAAELKGGEIIGLSGDLGAGKTVFTKGLAAGLGVSDNVNSPTFVIMKVYPIADFKSPVSNLVHIDAYRLQSAEDIKTIGADEYFARPDTITVIEWPEIIKLLLTKYKNIINITISANKLKRVICIEKKLCQQKGK